MITFLFISFLAGILTVLAPCILPLLPVIIGGSMSGEPNPKRAVVIIGSLGISVFIFTLVLKVSTAFITIPGIFWQILSGGLLIFFGLVTLAPALWDAIPAVNALYRNSNKLLGKGYKKQSALGDILIGGALGPVFSSCSPTYFVILAAVLPAHFGTGILYLFSYVLGLCLFLFLIAFFGQKAIAWLGIASDPKGWFKKTIGVLFILVGIAIIFGLDKKLEAALPAGAFGEIGIEQRLLSSTHTSAAPTSPNVQNGGSTGSPQFLTASEKELKYQKAPELATPDGSIHTGNQPISLAEYRGKDVVLVDFWDYTCINCQRTLPYLNAWYEKYKNQGLVIIGVHTPEFAFEHLQVNVEKAVQQFGIQYPVVLDNEYQTWNAFQNEYWPREYLVDIDGYIVHDHAGEGSYDETETAIQSALAERASRLGTGAVATSTVNIQPADLSAIQSPETYFGSARNQYLGNGNQGVPGVQTFTLPNTENPNTLYLGGTWNIASEYAESTKTSVARFEYSANDVYLVASADAPAKIKVLRDNQPIGNFAGADVDPKTSEATVNGNRLFKLIHDTNPGIHTIEIQVESGTLRVYTLTFG